MAPKQIAVVLHLDEVVGAIVSLPDEPLALMLILAPVDRDQVQQISPQTRRQAGPGRGQDRRQRRPGS